MRFLLSGSLFQKKGPCLLVLLTLYLALLGLLFHAVASGADWSRRWASTSPAADLLNTQSTAVESPDMTSQSTDSLLGDPQGIPVNESAGGFERVLLESLHIDLFLFSFYFLFIGSLVLQLPVPPVWPPRLIHALAISLLLFLAARVLAMLWSDWMWTELVAGVVFYLLYITITFLVLRHLYSAPGR